MRSVIMIALWLGIGFAITEFVASYLETRSVERLAAHNPIDPVSEARDLPAAGPATPSP